MATQDAKEPVEIHNVHGGKLTFHGFSYQLKLLMLFIARGLTNNLSFRVATEMEEAGRFDDVVFSQLNGVVKQFWFLQAKHSAGVPVGTITARNLLLGEKGDFCLPMYLQSYRNINFNPRFRGENKEIKGLILFTNKGFKYGDRFCDFQLRKEMFEKVKLNDSGSKMYGIWKTTLLRFKKNFEGKSFLVSHLKNAFVGIPKSFAKSVVEGAVFDLEKNLQGGKISDAYGDALLGEVVDSKEQSFRPHFVEAESLTVEASHFRDALKSELFAKHRGDETIFQEVLKNKRVEVIGKANQGEYKIDSPPKLAEKLAKLIKKNWDKKTVVVTDCKSLIARNIRVLAGNVFVRNMNGEIRFNTEFIAGNNLRKSILKFRKLLEHEMEKRRLDFSSINRFLFEIENFDEAPIVSSFPGEEIVEEFLENLFFAVDQPNETELDTLIKEEILREFKVHNAENVYSRFLVKTFNWMKDLKGVEFSHKEGRLFFENLKGEVLRSVRFGVTHPSSNFTGREKELAALQEALKEDNNNQCAAVISQSVVITGLPGVGKTELARKFIFIHSSEYDNVIWIDAKSSAAIGNSFHKLAFDKLGIPRENDNGTLKSLETIVSDVYDLLRGKRTLFVFDDARKLGRNTSDESDILNFLPRFPSESKHFTLITSLYQKWVIMKQINLEAFSLEEAVNFIMTSIDNESLNDASQAKDLAKALHCYPLALRQALSYIKARNEEKLILGQSYKISDYLQALEIENRELYSPRESYSYDSSTQGTWEITMRDIMARKGGKLAVKIVGVISYFSPDEISVENISHLFQLEGTSLIKSLILLKQYSLIKINGNKVSIHKIVQMITRWRLKTEEKEVILLRRMLRVGEKLDVEHSKSIWKYSVKYPSLIEEFNYLPSRIIQKLCDAFKFEVAQQFAVAALNVLEKCLGGGHESSLDVKENLAKTLHYLGRDKESLKIYEEVYKDRLLIQRYDHSKVLTVKHCIADVLSSIGKYEDALKCYEDLLEIVCMKYGKEHMDAFSVENNIAKVLYLLGDYEKALNSYQKVYDALKISIGQDHEKTLNVKLNLAIVLQTLGHLEKALSFYQEVYDKSKDSLNGNPLMCLDLMFNMASVYGKLGKYSDALKTYDEILPKLQDIYGADHPHVLDTKFTISYILYKLKEYKRSLKSYQEVGEAFAKHFGDNHERTLQCNFSTAHVLYNLGFYKKALIQYQDIHDKIAKSKGENHPSILPMKQSIAHTLCSIGNFDKAIQMYRENYQIIKLQLGGNHVKTIFAQKLLAKILFEQGEYKEAYEINAEIYRMMSKQYGELNKETLNAKHNIACALNKMGKLPESAVYFKDVYRKQMELLGEEHPLTKNTEKNLNKTLIKIQNQKSEKSSHLKNLTYSINVAESVEEEAESIDDAQSEQDCHSHCISCCSLTRCLLPIKTFLK